MENKKKAILFIAQYPENISPGQRFRFEQYKNLLIQNNYNIESYPFLNNHNFAINYKPGKIFSKMVVVIKGFYKRLILLPQVHKFDYIFIYREAAPVGFPLFEWLFTKVFTKKVIYDFDDAIWMPYEVTESSFFTKFFKNKSKVKKICSWVDTVSCGNDYLCNYAKQYNKNVIYNPTCVDTENRYNILANHVVKKVTIGWTGSFSTLNYFENLSPILKKLQEKYDFNIKIICNKAPDIDLKNVQYIAWTAEKEIAELATCQIGLMPLTDEEWSKGKCGFKLIQYLALGIPAVSSAVGVNSSIIEDGINGFLCTNEQEWYNALEKLLTNTTLREKMAVEGRKKIIASYSVESNKKNFLSIFN